MATISQLLVSNLPHVSECEGGEEMPRGPVVLFQLVPDHQMTIKELMGGSMENTLCTTLVTICTRHVPQSKSKEGISTRDLKRFNPRGGSREGGRRPGAARRKTSWQHCQVGSGRLRP